jgi:hypothetical protein
MKGKEKLVSPLLVIALILSLIGGATGAVLTSPEVSAQAPVLEVTITTPVNATNLYVSQHFAVKATIENTGDADATNVNAWIAFPTDEMDWVAGGDASSPHVIDNIGEPDNGDYILAPGYKAEVMWTLHCTNAGAAIITVDVDSDEGSPDTDAVIVNQLIVVDIFEPEIDCAGFEVCPSQDFTVRARVTNTGTLTRSINSTSIQIIPDANAVVTDGPNPSPPVDLDPGASQEFVWTLHCEAMSDDIILVEVFDGDGDLIGYDEYAFHQRGLLVDIVMPYDGQIFCVSQNFYVNAVVTNTCDDTIVGVDDDPLGVAVTIKIGGSASLAGQDSGRYTKHIGDIPGKLSHDVWWELHCDGEGPVTISVSAEGETVFGAYVSDYDQVDIMQGTGLEVEIVEPPFEWSADGFTVCVSQTFVVKAHVRNTGCAVTAYDVEVGISIDGPAEVIPEEYYKDDPYNIAVGDIGWGEEVIVGWTLHCIEVGDVFITVWAEDYYSYYYGEDTVTVHQADYEPVLTAVITEPDTSSKFSIACNNEFTVTAVINNTGCADAFDVAAELMWSNGPGMVYVPAPDKVQVVGDVPGPGSAAVSWTVTATVAGDVELWVEVTAGNHADVISPTVTIHVLEFLVEFHDVNGGGPAASIVVSTCQEFTVTVKFENNAEELAHVQAILDYTRIGAELVAGSTVDVEFFWNVSNENPDGEPDPTKPAESIPAEDTVPGGDLGYGLSTVDLERLCNCCYALVTWTLKCVGAIDGDLVATALTSGGIFLDDDSIAVDQQWKPHLVAGLDAFPGNLNVVIPSLDNFVTMSDTTFSVGQIFTVVATVHNIGQATAINVEITIEISGEAATDEPLTKVVDANIPGLEPGTIPGYHAGKAWWELECTGVGDVVITVPAAELGGVTGIDANSGEPILEDNIDILCRVEIEQVIGDFTVTIIQPFTCQTFTVGQEFTVKALVANNGDADVNSVSAHIHYTTTTATLVSEEPSYPAEKYLGDILVGRTHEVAWVLRCIAPGDVTITVTATAGFLEVTSDPVIVHQEGPSELDVDIVSPIYWSDPEWHWTGQYEVWIATSQEFAVTAYVSNPSVATAVNVVAYISTYTDGLFTPDVNINSWDSPEVLDSVSKNLGNISSGSGKMVTWTLHCDLPGVSDIWVDAWADNVPSGSGDWIEVVQYEAAHLEVEITAPEDGATITVSNDFDVTATVTNNGWADAWEVEATLSVFPEASVKLTESGTEEGDDARAGYTKYIGTLEGWGQNGSETVTWKVHCKEASNSTITVTPSGYDEFGYHTQKHQYVSYYPYDGTPTDVGVEQPPMGGSFYEYDLFMDPGAPIPDKFIEADSVTVKQEAPAETLAELEIILSSPEQVTIGQTFEVSGVLSNPGTADLADVAATLEIIGDAAQLAALETATKADGGIAAGGYGIVSWNVDAVAGGTFKFVLSATGTDVGSGATLNALTDPVVAASAGPLSVEISAPTQIITELGYWITAVVTNNGDQPVTDVTATLATSGPVTIASGNNPQIIGAIAAGSSAAASWQLDATSAGGVSAVITAEGTDTNTAVASAAVQQATDIDIDLSELVALVEESNTLLESIDGGVATLHTDNGNVEVAMADLADALGDIEVTIEDGNAAIVTAIGDVDASLADVNATLNSIDDGVATLDTDLGEIQTSLDSLNATATSVDDNVATITTDVGTIKGTVASIDDGVATVNTNLGTLQVTADAIAEDADTTASNSKWWLPIMILSIVAVIALIVGLVVGIIAAQRRKLLWS